MQTMLLILLPLGIGNYLASIDPQNWPWYDHLQHTLVLCQVHFKRNIEDRMVQGRVYVAGKHPEEYGLHYNPDYIRELTSRDFEAEKRVRTWAQNKANPVIAAAINRNCTKIDKDLFGRIRKHTNSNEQTGNKSNATGWRQRLLPAIEKSRILDRRDCDQATAMLVYGTVHTYRNPAMSSRNAEVFTREHMS
ncbi:hypothetical protein GcM3_102023 [Golovinomyces cichoracearum]|uniref:Glycosyl n=1 Tax=Golovinomyces cichoracearum TaxID=62708 RepID=A0A420IAA4_9PEZI|nr:hypothetical protein GcM3_102023 [Golovinomyces cichoracearum]